MATDEVLKRFETIRVADIMIPLADYPSVRPETTLRDAIVKLMTASLAVGGRKSLPRMLLVISDDEKLKGCVRRRDLMRGLEPKNLVAEPLDYRKKLFDVQIDPNLSDLSPESVVMGVREQAKRPVSEVMRPIKATVNADDHIIKAVYEMVSYSLSMLPVLKDRSVVGVLRSVEAMTELGNIVL